ncbi:GNAT family N-acetyltransferase [Agriterribacter sp.]|uniref:GNAT family N-acetyltransferase n=1 Tax=Agriterribacter sp. TaxID=2821509 RepID=UPI002C6CC03E|nr:GNAT family N-acetyltransferase [Agriterribacter sp.]HRO45846.1 GNAT family N-acetyltransferase [Agriterribacter sp.]HRQ16212.1 GNAT family N-acetyltransferase [Agriterribacter sp.]
MSYITVPLDTSHNKENFNCGKPLLNSCLHKQAKQAVKRRLSACFILRDGKEIKGYYTLSTASVEKRMLPQEIIKKLPPSYNDLPAILLGRLAINRSYQGQGLGELILMDALKRSYFASMQVGSMAVIVDPLDEEAVRFYKQYDFILLSDSGKMFLPMATIVSLFPDV